MCVHVCMCVHLCDSKEVTYYEVSVSEFKKLRYRESFNSNVKDIALGKFYIGKNHLKEVKEVFHVIFLRGGADPNFISLGPGTT